MGGRSLSRSTNCNRVPPARPLHRNSSLWRRQIISVVHTFQHPGVLIKFAQTERKNLEWQTCQRSSATCVLVVVKPRHLMQHDEGQVGQLMAITAEWTAKKEAITTRQASERRAAVLMDRRSLWEPSSWWMNAPEGSQIWQIWQADVGNNRIAGEGGDTQTIGPLTTTKDSRGNRAVVPKEIINCHSQVWSGCWRWSWGGWHACSTLPARADDGRRSKELACGEKWGYMRTSARNL